MNIDVNSALGPYTVFFGPGARDQLPQLVGDAARLAIIHPAGLGPLAERLAASVPAEPLLIPIPNAEDAKTTAVLEHCWNTLAAAGFTRSDVVLGLGGGTATDLAGFVAATWLRGVAYISVPTTVLAMVDAAVGGKTGINLASGKNLVGAFHEPRGVICDLDFLATLPAAEVRSGLAEVVKAGYISDPEILRLMAEDLGESQDVASDRFAEITRRAIQMKADVVALDLTERTSQGAQVGRESLNYGHTLGHAIESYHGYRMRHGEAISIGMMWIAHVSHELLGMDAEFVALHAELLGGLGLPLTHEAEAWPALRRAMSLDKKNRGGTLRLVGLSAQGTPQIIEAPPEDVLEEAYRLLNPPPG